MKRNNGYICETDCTSPRCPANSGSDRCQGCGVLRKERYLKGACPGGCFGDAAYYSSTGAQQRTKEESMKTTVKYIPEEIIKECAAKAFAAIFFYYDHNDELDRPLHNEPHRVQKRVIKDVKAVLYGNRTPAQLHEAWSARKIQACGFDMLKLREIAPTADCSFDYLSKGDQRGYELFVETVRETYKRLTKSGGKTASPIRGRLYRKSEDKSPLREFGESSGNPRVLIELYFDTIEAAEDFYDGLVKK